MAAVRHLLLLLLLPLLSSSQKITENEALLNLKKSFSNVQALPSWVPNQNPCSSRWEGVICIKNLITTINLGNFLLGGSIDVDALIQIPSLRSLSLMNNSFSGPIPPLYKLGALKSLYIGNNQFTGPIPSDYFSELESLKKLWLSDNQFSGPIPTSIAELRFLTELHLENNQFSGPVPDLKQEIKELDMSNNKLEGEIPTSMQRFSSNTFSLNEGLCGKPLDKACDVPGAGAGAGTGAGAGASAGTPPEEKGSEEGSSWGMKVIVLIIIGLALAAVFVMARSKRRKDEESSVMSRGRVDEVVQVHVPSSNHGGKKESKKSSRAGIGDIVMVNDEKGAFGLPDLMKASAEVLGNGGLGSAYKAAMSNGLSVVVKRMREMNKVSRDIFDAEMRRFGRLRNPNILSPLAYHYRKEEKLFVTQYMPKGSLLYVLHGDRGSSHADLNWPTRLKIVKGIARGLAFIYSQFANDDLPHGNLKSSNVILSENYEALLSDFAFHPLINHNYAVQTMFAYKTPDYVTYQRVSQKTDVYCLGIIVLEIITGKFPSQYHSNGKGGTDVVNWAFTAISERREAELIDPELMANHSASLNQMLQLVQIGAACTESNPDQRLTMKEAIRRIEELQV